MADETEVVLTPTVVWRISDGVVRALDLVLGDPHDTYVNGSQVWLDDDGPNGITIEWRLHPVAGFVRPPGITTDALFARVLEAVDTRADDPRADDPNADDLRADDADVLAADRLWDGLEAFPAYGDPVDAAVLGAWAGERLGVAPDAHGLVDHEVIAVAWEQAERNRSIFGDLLAQLGTT